MRAMGYAHEGLHRSDRSRVVGERDRRDVCDGLCRTMRVAAVVGVRAMRRHRALVWTAVTCSEVCLGRGSAGADCGRCRDVCRFRTPFMNFGQRALRAVRKKRDGREEAQ